jgi:adenine-specific DNA-methyltransferase
MDEVFGAKNFRNDITRIKCSPKNFQRRAYGNIKDLILFYTKTDDYIWNDVSVEIDEEDVTKRFNKIDANGRRYTTIPLHAPGETQSGPTGQEWRGIKPPKGRHWRSDPEILEELDKKGLIEWSKTGNPRKIVYADEAIQKVRSCRIFGNIRLNVS